MSKHGSKNLRKDIAPASPSPRKQEIQLEGKDCGFVTNYVLLTSLQVIIESEAMQNPSMLRQIAQ